MRSEENGERGNRESEFENSYSQDLSKKYLSVY